MAKESDIISIAVGETWRHAGMVAKATGSAITAGTVNYYLKCKTGTHAGKWWKNSDQTWAAVETANAMTHEADGNWTIELASSPFEDGVLYVEYAKESGNLHVAAEGKLLRGQESENGNGPHAVTITVNDGAVPTPAVLEGARVSLTKGAIVRTGNTSALGVVTFGVDAGTWTLAITADGYDQKTATLVVSAATASTQSLTAISFSPPADEDQVTGWGYVYAQTCLVEPSATVYIEQVSAGARNIYDSARRTLTADSNGLVSGVVWADGSEYRISRDGVNWSDPFAPEDDGDEDLPNSYRFPGLLGTS